MFWTDDPVRDASRWNDYLDENGVTLDEWDQYQRDLRLEEFRSMLEDELMNKADDDRKLEEEDEEGDY